MKKLTIVLLSIVLVPLFGCNPITAVYRQTTTSPSPIASTTTWLTPTPSEATSPSQTSSPLLSPDGVAARMEQWLEGSPECRFPCWGNMTPGMTTWEEAKQIIESSLGNQDVVFMENINQVPGICCRVEINWATPDNPRKLHGFIYGDSNRLVYMILFGVTNPELTYRLDSILTQYGIPEKVFLDIIPISLTPEDLHATFVLVYPKYRFIIRYSWGAHIVGENLVSCIGDRFLSVDLNINPPIVGEWTDAAIKETEYGSEFVNSTPFKSLDKVTDFTIENFYKEFRNIEGNECIVTPIKNWP